MNNFTVKDIADILKTNPETVRRWIRDGKLESIQVTRKDGNVVSEAALKEFLQKTPKYATIAASSLSSGFSSIVGVVAGASILAASAIVSKYITSDKEDQITPDNLEKYVQLSIKECQETIRKRNNEIDILTKQIREEQEQINDLQKVLENIKAFTKPVEKSL